MIRSGATSQRLILFLYFLLLILAGTLLLMLPAAGTGAEPVSWADACFTSVSAVCVTGLVTLDASAWSPLGHVFLLILIQMGGLGIIIFTTLTLTMPGRKWSLVSSKLVRQYSIDAVEYRENRILRMVVGYTLAVEVVGAVLLYFFLPQAGDRAHWFDALFHSVSAFCNAGFSMNPDSLESFGDRPAVLLILMGLIIFGGIGFVVIRDLYRSLVLRRGRLSLHSKIVLITTAILILLPALGYWLMERNSLLAGMGGGLQFVHSLFQSVTTRTAGFNALPQGELSEGSLLMTLPLMFIGGAPGSIAGGIKVTTFALIVLALLKGPDNRLGIRIGRRRIPSTTLAKAHLFAAKGLFMVALATVLLLVSEPFALREILFEVFSAFGTVGLSTGITGDFSTAGKTVLMLTMFAGRVGLISMTIPLYKEVLEKYVDYPSGEVMIG